ncbi:MAG: cobalamin-dependent protein [Oligoflexales bacterium]|nr:cobalamin-dependent protein [Oligoflexales bacterium]
MIDVLFVKPSAKAVKKIIAPPLGIMSLSSQLKKRGYSTGLVDMPLHSIPEEDAVERIISCQPKIVGFTVMSIDAPLAYRMARKIREEAPHIMIVMGGAHPTADAQDVVFNGNVDLAFIGESEISFTEFVEAFLDGREWRRIGGLAYEDHGMLKINRLDSLVDVDSIFPPDWDLVDLKRYHRIARGNPTLKSPKYASLLTSRGCVFKCTYCHGIFGSKVRQRKAELVFDEIRDLHSRYGVDEFIIADDIFNYNTSRAERICDLIIGSGLRLHLSFPVGLRADIMTPGLLHKMKLAGTHSISYAIETAAPRMQSFINKKLNLDKTREIIKLTDREGISTRGFFLLGLPTETPEETQLSIDFANASRLNYADFMSVQPFPGTEMSRQVEALGFEWAFDPSKTDYYEPIYNFTKMERLKLVFLFRKANFLFYFNIRRLIRAFRLAPRRSLYPFVIFFYLLRITASYRQVAGIRKHAEHAPEKIPTPHPSV